MSQVRRTIDNENSAAAIRSLLQSRCGFGKNLICTAVCEQPGELGSDTARKNLSTQPALKIQVGFWFKVRVNENILFEELHTLAELQ
jgi:hypothetical protein